MDTSMFINEWQAAFSLTLAMALCYATYRNKRILIRMKRAPIAVSEAATMRARNRRGTANRRRSV